MHSHGMTCTVVVVWLVYSGKDLRCDSQGVLGQKFRSQEEIVREVGGVGHDERVGGEELRRRDRARARHVAADHAARRHSAACGREGAVQALAVQRARGGRPGDGQRGARERTGGCEARRGCCA